MIFHSKNVTSQPLRVFLFFSLCIICGLSGHLMASFIDITQPGDTIIGIPSRANAWPSNESPPNVIDNNVNSKYLHFDGPQGIAGFRITPSGSSAAVVGLTFTTANDHPERDPIAYEFSGSHDGINGPYTVISAGVIADFDQASPWPRYAQNAAPILFPNSTVYSHYQLVFTAVREPFSANSVQIAEVELLGAPEGGWPPTVDAGLDQIAVLPYTQIELNGDVSFFGDVPASVELAWTLLSAPDGVEQGDLEFIPSRFAADPLVTLPAVSGVYVLSLTVTTEHHVVSDSLQIYVSRSLCPTGDLNGDCRVDLGDLLILADSWLERDAPLGNLPNPDGRDDGVGFSDFAFLAENWFRSGPPAVISEFMAVNRAKHPLAENELVDEDGDSSDWIELCNPTPEAVDLTGWYLTDRQSNLARWRIPSLVLEPEELVVIFASGKNRRTFGEPYHTNFSLTSAPDYLALVAPDGETIVHEYSYPAQYGGISYGLASPAGEPTETISLLAAGAPAYAKIPVDNSLGLTWTGVDFEPAGWMTGSTGVGYERETGFEPWIGLDVTAMYGVNTSIYIRVPFEVEDLTGLEGLTLWMMYDDGFVAYLNDSVPVALANAPVALAWNSQASRSHDDAEAVTYKPFLLPQEALESLRIGPNVLSIHGLNRGVNSSDFLILPRLTAERKRSAPMTSSIEAYFQDPTPGTRNKAGRMNLGPVVREVTRNPVPPLETDDLLITALIEPAGRPIGQVQMVYRVGFGEEVAVPMNDQGQGGDAAADDGVYSAVIPASAYHVGQMVRWFIRAYDDQGVESRNPEFLLPENSPRYFGTVVRDSSLEPPLQTLYYFVQDTASEATRGGTRCSVFFMDEFYDNVFIRIRGGNYAENTGSRKIDFNDGEKFLFHPRFDRVDEINLNGTGADITFLRPPLSFETYEAAGLPSSIAFPLRIIRNNSDPYLRMFVEQPDRHLLRRVGLDDNGAYYKMYSDLNASLSGESVERKLTRLDEDNSDLKALAGGIAPENPNRGIFLFDNVNIPAVISYLAVSVLIHENDHTHKNYYIYRDTNTTGEWMFIPWDKDLTFGLNHGIPGIAADQDWPHDPDRSPSHPFYGSRYHQKIDHQWNRLFDAVFADPVARQMYLRRLRTLMDAHLQPPSTPAEQLRYEQRIDELTAQMASLLNSPAFEEAVEAIKTEYLPVRRTHLYVNHREGSTWPDDMAGIPESQPDWVAIQIGTIEDNPVSGNRSDDYIEIVNPNPFAVDISGWILHGGGVSHTFPGGTVIPAARTLYLTPDAIAFRRRAVSPRGGEYRFVQGNYRGRLSRWGGTLTLYDVHHRSVVSKAFEGNPSEAQRYLRITELMYNPSSPEASIFDTQDYEYVEMVNVGPSPLLLNGVAFTKGIAYAFPDGVVLEPGGYLVLAKELAAFHSRFTVPQGVMVVGGYGGQLSNSGEELILADAAGEVIHQFAYSDTWQPLTGGEGFSLTKHDPADSPLSSWNEKNGWRASSYSEGSPGQDDPGLGIAPGSIVINEVLAHALGMSDWIELYNTTDADIPLGGWFLSDRNTNDPGRRQYEIPPTILPAGGYLVFYENETFGNPEAQGCLSPFGLSRFGETVYLFSGQDGQVTGHYYAEQAFGVSRTGVSFGRYEKPGTGEWDFVELVEMTPGASNADPAVGPVVIRELMYHPPAGGAYDKEEYEYIELRNITGYPVPMSEYDAELDKTFGWRLSNGIEFEFPPDSVIPPGDVIVLVRNIDAFGSRYPTVSPEKIAGSYSGRLNNNGETVDLLRPGQDDNGVRRYLLIDRVAYSNGYNPVGQDAWPPQANGTGMALGRVDDGLYGNSAANWQAGVPTPGKTPDDRVPVVVHYWHFNDLSGTVLSASADYSVAAGGASITYPGIGEGYMDTADGTGINAQGEHDAGSSLRVRNPSDTRQLFFALPTEGYEQVRLSYAVMRTSNGAQEHRVEYRISPVGDWQQIGDSIWPVDYYTRYVFDFSGIAGVDNNPHFAVRIIFSGSNASGATGNNRFDNVALEGFPMNGL